MKYAIAWRAAQDLPDGALINLGRGLPTQVVDHVPRGRRVMLQSENGLLGIGPRPAADAIDPDITNASKDPVTLVPGASIFDLVESFDMIRGGHIDLVLLGGFQVSAAGDLANWATSADGELPPAIGGAMDLASACPTLWVLMTHQDRDGSPKLVRQCSYPLTSAGNVSRIYTDLATLEVVPGRGLRVLERCADMALADLQAVTDAPLFEDLPSAPLRAAPAR